MNEFKSSYLSLFNQITDTIDVLEAEIYKLKKAQLKVEEIIISINKEGIETSKSKTDK